MKAALPLMSPSTHPHLERVSEVCCGGSPSAPSTLLITDLQSVLAALLTLPGLCVKMYPIEGRRRKKSLNPVGY